MKELLHSEIFILTLVIGVYLAAVWLFRKTKLNILHPLLVSIPVLAVITHVLGVSFEEFEKGSRIISFMLGPTVVVLGYLLYEQMAQLKENAVSIITSVFVGCVTGIAQPQPYIEYLKKYTPHLTELRYPDHHHFTKKDIQHIVQAFQGIQGTEKYIFTTEKDAMRLITCSLPEEIKQRIYYIPVVPVFLQDEDLFLNEISEYVRKNKK